MEIVQDNSKKNSDFEYKCTICEKSYSLKSSFRTHLKSVHDEKTLNCEKCDMSFRFSCYLERHEIDFHGAKYLRLPIKEKFVSPCLLLI